MPCTRRSHVHGDCTQLALPTLLKTVSAHSCALPSPVVASDDADISITLAPKTSPPSPSVISRWLRAPSRAVGTLKDTLLRQWHEYELGRCELVWLRTEWALHPIPLVRQERALNLEHGIWLGFVFWCIHWLMSLFRTSVVELHLKGSVGSGRSASVMQGQYACARVVVKFPHLARPRAMAQEWRRLRRRLQPLTSAQLATLPIPKYYGLFTYSEYAVTMLSHEGQDLANTSAPDNIS